MARFSAFGLAPVLFTIWFSARPNPSSDVLIIGILSGVVAICLMPAAIAIAKWRGKPVITVWPFLLSPILIASVALTNWPMRAAFKWSKPHLESYIKSLESDETNPGEVPRMVGCFHILRVDFDQHKKIANLWTDLDPNGKTGLVRAQNSDRFNVWSETRVGDHWIVLSED